MAKRPRIGITGPNSKSPLLWWFTKMAVRKAGGMPLPITPRKPLDANKLDGFVIMGGNDIEPAHYGEVSLLSDPNYDPDRDKLEMEIIRHALEEKKPILGICRGMQLMNVALGGNLYQEAKDVLEGFLPHESLISKIIGRREVSVDTHSKLFRILGGYHIYRVNSIHHQAVNQIGDGLSIVAKEENGLIQATEALPELMHPFFIGVQWHPELMQHAPSARRLFRALIIATKPH